MFEKSMLFIHSWVLPFTCILCKKSSDRKQDLCQACLQSLPIITQNSAKCPPPLSGTTCLYVYEGSVAAMILELKFKGQLAYARILGELMAAQLAKREGPLPDVILPVPLHARRLKERGFNQAVELARPIGKALGIRVELRAVRRIRDTPAQMKLSGKERRLNIMNAFRVEKSLAGKRVALVDDVMTTGSTLTELGSCLLKAGAIEVEAWCCARAL